MKKILLLSTIVLLVCVYLFGIKGYDSFGNGQLYSSKELREWKMTLFHGMEIADKKRETQGMTDEEYEAYLEYVLDSLGWEKDKF